MQWLISFSSRKPRTFENPNLRKFQPQWLQLHPQWLPRKQPRPQPSCPLTWQPTLQPSFLLTWQPRPHPSCLLTWQPRPHLSCPLTWQLWVNYRSTHHYIQLPHPPTSQHLSQQGTRRLWFSPDCLTPRRGHHHHLLTSHCSNKQVNLKKKNDDNKWWYN